MTKLTTKITNLATLEKAKIELQNLSEFQRTNIVAKTNHLKENFFLKTDNKKYAFDRGQKIKPALLKLALKKILNPKSKIGNKFTTLISTFIVQSYGKKLSKRLHKLTNLFLI